MSVFRTRSVHLWEAPSIVKAPITGYLWYKTYYLPTDCRERWLLNGDQNAEFVSSLFM